MVEFMMKSQEKDNDLFFQIYFDIVAQGCFYSFFYAFPKSRQQFDNSYKKYVFETFAGLFTGIAISNTSEFVKGWKFINNWCLDLGAGDVLKQSNTSKVNSISSKRLRI